MKPVIILFLYLLTCGILNSVYADQGIDHPKLKWKFKTQGPIRGSAVILKDKIYFGSSDGFVYALNKNDGSLIWKYQTNGAIAGPPTVTESAIYVTSRDNFIYSLNNDSGVVNWKFQMKEILPDSFPGWDYFTAAPVVTGNRLLAGSGDGYLYSLDLKSGKIQWKFKTKGRIRATPLVYKDVIYQPSNDGFIYALDLNGQLLWKFETQGATYNSGDYGYDRNSIFTQPLIKNDLMIFASRDGNTYAVDLNIHEKKWNFTYGSTWAMSVSLSDNMAFVGWSDNNLTCAIDIATGQEKWNFKSGAYVYTTPLILDSAVYIGSGDGKIYKLNKNTGKKYWDYNIGDEINSSLKYDSGSLFFGCDNGYFYALEEGTAPYKAVYLPTYMEGNTKYLVVNDKIIPYLKDRGFSQIDSAGLYKFINDRIKDKNSSVVVFAFPVIPKSIIGNLPEKGMIRQYLEGGGKIVWMGDIPNYYALDEAGNFKRDATIGSRLLGVQFNHPSESGNYYSKVTQEGLNWGLPEWINTTNSTVEGEGVIPLAYDEFGRISLWIKKFNARPGSGFISIRTWPWNVPIQNPDLELIYQFAIHQLE